MHGFDLRGGKLKPKTSCMYETQIIPMRPEASSGMMHPYYDAVMDQEPRGNPRHDVSVVVWLPCALARKLRNEKSFQNEQSQKLVEREL